MSDIILENVFFIDCPEHELEKRMVKRAQMYGRSDDNPATLKKRFVTFQVRI